MAQKEEFEKENAERIAGEYDRLKNELSFTKESVTNSKDEIKQKQDDIESLKKTIEASLLSDKEDDQFIVDAIEKKEELAKIISNDSAGTESALEEVRFNIYKKDFKKLYCIVIIGSIKSSVCLNSKKKGGLVK